MRSYLHVTIGVMSVLALAACDKSGAPGGSEHRVALAERSDRTEKMTRPSRAEMEKKKQPSRSETEEKKGSDRPEVDDQIYDMTIPWPFRDWSAGPAKGDSDGDGVRDAVDRCPDTPSGAKVDKRGCPDLKRDVATQSHRKRKA